MTDMERTDRRTDNGVQSVTDLLYGRSQNRVIKLDDFVSFIFIYYKQQRANRPLTCCNIQRCIHDTVFGLSTM